MASGKRLGLVPIGYYKYHCIVESLVEAGTSRESKEAAEQLTDSDGATEGLT